ncbi:hypothetical protein SDJN03_29165, partial [Cucurbita argyrosperma subsp. sororia]
MNATPSNYKTSTRIPHYDLRLRLRLRLRLLKVSSTPVTFKTSNLLNQRHRQEDFDDLEAKSLRYGRPS